MKAIYTDIKSTYATQFLVIKRLKQYYLISEHLEIIKIGYNKLKHWNETRKSMDSHKVILINFGAKNHLVKQHMKNEQNLIVLMKYSNNKFLVLNIDTSEIFYKNKEDIIKDINKYFNIKLIKNRLKIIHKFRIGDCDKNPSATVLERYEQVHNFNNKAKILGDKEFKFIVDIYGDCTLYKHYSNKLASKNVKIPDFVDIIGALSFLGQGSIRSLILGENVRYIREYAFSDCSNLSEIRLNNKLKYIGNAAFKKIAIKNIVFNNTLEEIGISAFLGCKLLETVKFNKKLRYIGERAFKECKITQVKCRGELIFLGKDAFMSCGVQEADFENTKLHYISLSVFSPSENEYFSNNQQLRILKLPKNCDYININELLYSYRAMEPQYKNVLYWENLDIIKLPINFKKLQFMVNRDTKNKICIIPLKQSLLDIEKIAYKYKCTESIRSSKYIYYKIYESLRNILIHNGRTIKFKEET